MPEPKEPRPVGRPAILDDPDKRKEFLAAVSLGTSLTRACLYVGIRDLKTLRLYRQSHPDFDQDLVRADVRGELWHLDNWRRGAEGRPSDKGNEVDWRASSEYLGRKYPKRWARHLKHEVTGKNGGAIKSENETTFNVKNLSTEDLVTLRNIRIKASTPDDRRADSAAGNN